MRKAAFICCLLQFCVMSYTQIKSVKALRITDPIKIDGVLNEAAYASADIAGDFVQLNPHNGAPSYQKSEIRLLYDNTAVYVGAMLYDENPDSIFNFLSERDNIGLSDYFGVYFDPYNEGLNAYGFFITPAGVQTDLRAIKKDYDYEDSSWDAVWESKTSITNDGWIVEMRIPFSALRFPQKEVHVWGLNFFRQIRRYNSNNSWSRVDNTIIGFIQQQGTLTGIENVEPPMRLSLYPYISAYAQNHTNTGTEYVFKGGMDLKYGISESFTLDMMLIPDFGQVQSDDQELNLSPYELYFDERRQFFTEGMELYDRADVFYSRRIGGIPKFRSNVEDNLAANEKITENPLTTDIVNATKVTGRTKNGVGLGMLNAMTLESRAEVRDTLTGKTREIVTQPFTNYNVSVIEKSLQNNSYVSLINTNMKMYCSPWIANVTGTEFKLNTKENKYTFEGKGAVSYKYNAQTETGYMANVGFKKSSGNFLGGIVYEVLSDTYDPNDMGYLYRNNEILTELYLRYNLLDPKGIYNQWYNRVWVEHRNIYNPYDVYGTEVGLSTYMVFKNFMEAGIYSLYNTSRHDYYETRNDHRYYLEPEQYLLGFNYGTDGRKRLDFDTDFGAYKYPSTGQNGYWVWAELEWRIGQKLKLEYDFNKNANYDNIGYVDENETDHAIYFGRRNLVSIENTLEVEYIFNNKMSLSFRGRHYWSGARYKQFYILNSDGTLNTNTSYNEPNNVNFNAFTVDMVYRWIFAPGSEISIAWKNNIYDDDNTFEGKYRANLNRTFAAAKLNSLSVKALYYIDFNSLKKRDHKVPDS